ncbi:MAG: palindromic element RPE5 domain-containing protein [Rickettsia aeschlimannii]
MEKSKESTSQGAERTYLVREHRRTYKTT